MAIKARLLILSDTHDDYENLTDLPNADILLHCGDLTQIGGLSNYRRAITMMKNALAELKLVIAGNHDVSLDTAWWRDNLIEDEDDPEEPLKALELFQSQDNIEAGIHYLQEGVHKFTLKSGATFTIYASPYTPEFNGYAFPYARDEDRFNPVDKVAPGIKSTTVTSIPEGVDIVMTHGPPSLEEPSYALDIDREGEHCGCAHLFRAIERTRPRLHCFGHLHEGRGIQVMSWTKKGGERLETLADSRYLHSKDNVIDVSNSSALIVGPLARLDQTLLVNAVQPHQGEEHQPWVVDLDLDVAN